MVDTIILSFWEYHSSHELEIFGGEYTKLLATYCIDHDITSTDFETKILGDFVCSAMGKGSPTELFILHPTYDSTPTNDIRCMMHIHRVVQSSLCFQNTVITWDGQIFTSNRKISDGQVGLLFSILTHLCLRTL